MTYIEGFILAAPTANRDVYRAHAMQAMPMFREFGATRMVETWGDDVPHGTVNDFHGAVLAKADETVLFSWIEYPDRATRDAANARIMTDPRMAAMGEPPFDASRMIWSGFVPVVEAGVGAGPGGTPAYVDGFLLPVSPAKRDAYVAMAERASAVFLDHGALRVVEAWGDDLMRGETTDPYRATHARDDETVVFSWIEWPSKAVRDAGMQAAMADPRMQSPQSDLPFDGRRMIYGGFAILLDA